LSITVCRFQLFLFVIAFTVLRFTAFDFPIGILKLFLHTPSGKNKINVYIIIPAFCVKLARENRRFQRGSQKKMSEAPVLLTNVECDGHYKTFQKVCVRKVLRYLWGNQKL
jgi:hypothetical protein